MWKRRRQPAWMAKLRPGDILQARSGTQRVVREFTPHPVDGKLLFVKVVIRHCSWTGHWSTLLDCDQLKRGGYRPLRKRARMRGPLDKKVNAICRAENAYYDGLMGRGPRRKQPRKLTCCDVHGVA